MAGERYSRDEAQLYSFFKGVTVLFGNEVSLSTSLDLLVNGLIGGENVSDLPT